MDINLLSACKVHGIDSVWRYISLLSYKDKMVAWQPYFHNVFCTTCKDGIYIEAGLTIWWMEAALHLGNPLLMASKWVLIQLSCRHQVSLGGQKDHITNSNEAIKIPPQNVNSKRKKQSDAVMLNGNVSFKIISDQLVKTLQMWTCDSMAQILYDIH